VQDLNSFVDYIKNALTPTNPDVVNRPDYKNNQGIWQTSNNAPAATNPGGLPNTPEGNKALDNFIAASDAASETAKSLKGTTSDLFKWNDLQSDGMGKQKTAWDAECDAAIAAAQKTKDAGETSSQKVTEAATTFKTDVTSTAGNWSTAIDASRDKWNTIDFSKPATALTQAATTAGQTQQKYSEAAGTALSLGAQVGANFTRDGGNAVRIGLTASGKEIAVIGSVAQQQFAQAGGQWVASTTAGGNALRTGFTETGQKIAVIGSVAQQQFAAAGNQFKSDGASTGSQFRSDGAATGSGLKSDGAAAGNELIAGAQQASRTFADFYSSMAGSDFARSLSVAKGVGNSGSVPLTSNNPPNDSGWLNGGYNAEGSTGGETSASGGLSTSPALKGNDFAAVYNNAGTCIAYVQPDKSLKFTPAAQNNSVLDETAFKAVYDDSSTCVAFVKPDPSLKFTPGAQNDSVLDEAAFKAVYDDSGTCIAFVKPDPSLRFTPSQSTLNTAASNQLDQGMTKAVGTLTQGATQASQTGILSARQQSQIGLQGATQVNQMDMSANLANINAQNNLQNQIATRSLGVAQQTGNITLGTSQQAGNTTVGASNAAANNTTNASAKAGGIWNDSVLNGTSIWGGGVNTSKDSWITAINTGGGIWSTGVDSTGKIIIGAGVTFGASVVSASAQMVSSVSKATVAMDTVASSLSRSYYGANAWYQGGASGLNQYLNGPNAPTWPVWMTNADPSDFPASAEGGIFSKATIRKIGEAGREAIVPLDDKAAGMRILASILPEFSDQSQPSSSSSSGGAIGGGDRTLTIVLDSKILARAIMPHAVKDIKIKTGGLR
jgi:hypothetical protein